MQNKTTQQVPTRDGSICYSDCYSRPQWYVAGSGFQCELLDLLKLGEYSSIVRREDGSYDTVATHKLSFTYEFVRFPSEPCSLFPRRAGKSVHDSMYKRRLADARDKARNAWV